MSCNAFFVLSTNSLFLCCEDRCQRFLGQSSSPLRQPWHCFCFGNFPFRRFVNAALNTSQDNIIILNKCFAGIEGLVYLIFEIRHQLARAAAKALTFIEIGRLCAHVTDLNHGASFLLSPRKTTLLNDACHHGDANAVRCEHLQRQTSEPHSRI